MLGLERLAEPAPTAARDFQDVLRSRRSATGGPVGPEAIGTLLRHITSETARRSVGRAGMMTRRRAAPSAGGLHPFHLVCIDDRDGLIRWYDPDAHAFGLLDVDAAHVAAANASAVASVLGRGTGCTIRFLADVGKVFAAYEEPLSLIWREAGALLATLALTAEWLNLSACPLGFLGQELVGPLGFPEPRFLAAGAVQVGSRQDRDVTSVR